MIATISIIGISVLFVIASTALFLFRGKSKFWTAKKMKLGAILLTLTATLSMTSCREEEPMCYETVELSDWVEIENFNESLNLNETNILDGKIRYRSSDIYSFFLKNDNDTSVFQKNLLKAKDGTFNDTTELFSIELDTNLTPGDYTLSFFDAATDTSTYSIADYHFKITK